MARSRGVLLVNGGYVCLQYTHINSKRIEVVINQVQIYNWGFYDSRYYLQCDVITFHHHNIVCTQVVIIVLCYFLICLYSGVRQISQTADNARGRNTYGTRLLLKYRQLSGDWSYTNASATCASWNNITQVKLEFHIKNKIEDYEIVQNSLLEATA